MNAGRFLIKLNRISAWILLALMVVFLASGYAWWNRILLPLPLARYLHTELDIYLVLFFLVHSLTSIRLMLIRWRVGHARKLSLLLLAIGIAAFWLVLSIR